MATRQERPSRSGPARGREAPQKRSVPLRYVLIGIGALVAVVIGLAIAFGGGRGGVAPAAVAPGGPVPTMTSRDHTPERVEYSTNPPTSGNHDPNPATQGVYNTSAPPDEKLVHNLEHGNIVMYYNPEKLDEGTIEQFRELTRDLNRSRANPCAILAPRTSIQDDKPIALTAWGALATLDTFDEAQIRAFWRDYVAKGPEFPAGQCG
jgi:hypothetical protein